MAEADQRRTLSYFVSAGIDQWQKKQVDAFYSLPSTLAPQAPVFGSSTRSDWENTVKNKRDGSNAYAGPGNYNIRNLGVLSTSATSPRTIFQCASRSSSHETFSPGPVRTEIFWMNSDLISFAGLLDRWNLEERARLQHRFWFQQGPEKAALGHCDRRVLLPAIT